MSIYDGNLKSKHSSISLYIYFYFGIQRSVEGNCNLYMEAFFFLDISLMLKSSAEQPWLLMCIWMPVYLWFWFLFHHRFPRKDRNYIWKLWFSGLFFKVKKLSKRCFLSAGTLFLLLVLVLVWSNTYIPGSSDYPPLGQVPHFCDC